MFGVSRHYRDPGVCAEQRSTSYFLLRTRGRGEEGLAVDQEIGTNPLGGYPIHITTCAVRIPHMTYIFTIFHLHASDTLFEASITCPNGMYVVKEKGVDG